MDFRRKTRRREIIHPRLETDELDQLYPHNVVFYRRPPTHEISLKEFEDLAIERIKLLRILEQTTSRNLKYLSEEWKTYVTAEMNREGLKSYLRLVTGGKKDLQARRRDYVSHFILRLAYHQNEELRKWFVSRELELFKWKFSALQQSELKEFLKVNGFDYVPLTEDEKLKIKNGLSVSTVSSFGLSSQVESLDFYKVDFVEVLDLIRTRRCYLKDGCAFVNSSDFVSIIAGKFQMELERGLKLTQMTLPQLENDPRLSNNLSRLHTSYVGKDYTVDKTGGVSLDSIEQLSVKSFPLCMKNCHEALRANHHLKHGARLQYGLFLKGIGLSYEDAMQFWRQEFTKSMDLERFEKHYAYNIKHSYGKVGSMINYSPYSCMKIITTPVGPQDGHGCPFKHVETSKLKQKLINYGLSPVHAQEICGYASQGHYQIACGKYLELSHDSTVEEGINHPIQYFEISQEIMSTNVTNKTRSSAPIKRNVNPKVEMSSTIDSTLESELWEEMDVENINMDDTNANDGQNNK